MRILVVDDDPEIIGLLKRGLSYEGYTVETAADGTDALAKARDHEPDLVILDVMMPGIDGLEVSKRLRQAGDVPILMLTAKGGVTDIVAGLGSGADDYLVKPFAFDELLARVKALIRRQSPADEETVASGPLRLEVTSGQVHLDGKEISLTITESRILAHLMRNAGHIVTHSSLAESVWGNDYPGAADSLKVHIRRLREKIEANPSQPRFILTKAGVGYFLAKPE